MKGRRHVDDSPSENCCLVIPVTMGTTIVSALAIMSSVMSFISAAVLLKNPSYFSYLVENHTAHAVKVLAYSVIGFSAMLFVFATFAIHAVYSRKPAFLVPFGVFLVFGCVASFFVLLDQLHRYSTGHQYGHHRLFVSTLSFLIKIYFLNCVHQCYQHLRGVAARRQRVVVGGEESAHSPSTYIVLPKYEELADTQPPAYDL